LSRSSSKRAIIDEIDSDVEADVVDVGVDFDTGDGDVVVVSVVDEFEGDSGTDGIIDDSDGDEEER